MTSALLVGAPLSWPSSPRLSTLARLRQPSLPPLLLAGVLAALFGTCDVDERGAGPTKAPTRLSQTRAAAGLSFATNARFDVALEPTLTRSAGRYVFVRIALDPKLEQLLYLGRLRGARLRRKLSVPTTTTRLYYELYDEHGRLARGTLKR